MPECKKGREWWIINRDGTLIVAHEDKAWELLLDWDVVDGAFETAEIAVARTIHLRKHPEELEPPDPPEEFLGVLTLKDARELTGISDRMFQRWISDGVLFGWMDQAAHLSYERSVWKVLASDVIRIIEKIEDGVLKFDLDKSNANNFVDIIDGLEERC